MKSRFVVGAVLEKDGKILMGQKPKNKGPYPNSWHLPGGGVEKEDKSPEEALKREIREEVNIEINNLQKISEDEDFEPNGSGEMTHYTFWVYKADYSSGEPKASDDLENVQWFTKKELQTLPLTRPSQKLFKKLGWIK